MEEFEIKFLEVDVPELEKKLVAIGAKKVAEYDYSRAIVDYPDFRLREQHSWIRIRTDGKESTITFKQRIGERVSAGNTSDTQMKEIGIIINDYNKGLELLKAIGLVVIREEKNRRVRYKRGEVIFDIDFWPQIPTYLEIEANSLSKAREASRLLGFDPKNGLICSAGAVYRKYGIIIEDYSSMTFEKFVKK